MKGLGKVAGTAEGCRAPPLPAHLPMRLMPRAPARLAPCTGHSKPQPRSLTSCATAEEAAVARDLGWVWLWKHNMAQRQLAALNFSLQRCALGMLAWFAPGELCMAESVEEVRLGCPQLPSPRRATSSKACSVPAGPLLRAATPSTAAPCWRMWAAFQAWSSCAPTCAPCATRECSVADGQGLPAWPELYGAGMGGCKLQACMY